MGLTSPERANGRRTRDPDQRLPPVPAEAVDAEDPVPGEGGDDLGVADALVGDHSDPQRLAGLAAESLYPREEDLNGQDITDQWLRLFPKYM